MAGLDVLRSAWTLLLAWGTWKLGQLVYNVFLHPLRRFPGPRAAAATGWWKAYVEVYMGESMTDVLIRLHKQYGDIVRIAPNELHFGNPHAFHDIYSPHLRWDKDADLYRSFGEDHSSFGFLTYAEANERKDVLRPLFSRRAILGMQQLVHGNALALADALAARHASLGVSSDLLFAFRCYAMDTITSFCFARSVDALATPVDQNFRAPIVEALDITIQSFPVFRHFPTLRRLVFAIPPAVLGRVAPDMAGLTSLQVLLDEQVRSVLAAGPEALEQQRQQGGGGAAHQTIFHRLIDPAAQRPGHWIPDARSLYEEAQTMLFAGSVTVGDALTVGLFHVLAQPDLHAGLRREVRAAWPAGGRDAPPPPLEHLEALPLLVATVKESLRHSPGVASPMLRVVPPSGAVIGGAHVSGGTVVGMSTALVHMSEGAFGPDAAAFRPGRWLGAEGEDSEAAAARRRLDGWLVPFSRGPRSCLGLNLAHAELFIAFAVVLTRLDLELDGTTAEDMVWRDCFTPHFYRRHLHAWCAPAKERGC